MNDEPIIERMLTDDAAARAAKWLSEHTKTRIPKSDCIYESVQSLMDKLLLPKDRTRYRDEFLKATWGKLSEAVNE